MSKKINVEALKPIESVVRVYSGCPGCACGCRGKYWPDSNNKIPTNRDIVMFKRIYKLFSENLQSVFTWESTKDQFVALDIGKNRTYTMYYHK